MHDAPDNEHISFLKKLGSDSFSMFIARILSLVFSLARIMVISRFLGVAAFGVYSFGMSVAIMVTVLGNFGLSTLVARDGARDRTVISPLVSNGMILMLIFSIVLLSLFTGIMFLLETAQDLKPMFVLLLITFLFQNVSMMLVGVFQACERIRLIGALHVFLEAVTLLCVISVFGLGAQLTGLCAGLAAAYLFRVIFLYNRSKTVYAYSIMKPELPKIKYILTEGYAIAIMEILLQVYIYVDTIMLMFLQDARMVGIYHGGFRLYQIMIILPAALGFAGLPVLSRTFRDNTPLFRELFRKSFQWLILLGLPLAFGSIIYADNILFSIFGDAFMSSVSVFRILMITIPFTYMAALFSITLISMDLHRTCMKLFIVTILLNMALNLLFIPLFRASGPAISTLCSECFFMFAGFNLLKYYIRVRKETVILHGIISTLIMSGAVLTIKYYLSWFIPGIIAGMVIYMFCLLLMGALKIDDLMLFIKGK